MNLNLSRIIKYILILSALIAVVIVTPVFYQTYQYLHTDYATFPERSAVVDETEVYLIATRHIPTDTYNKDTLYKTLEKIQPDIILLELNDRYFRNDRIKWQYSWVMSQWQFLRKYRNLEILAATKFTKNHPTTLLAPYEWDSTASVYKKITGKNRTNMLRALMDTNSDKGYQTLQECSQLNSYSLNLATQASFNSNRTDSLLERFTYLEYEVLPELILQDDSLKAYHDFAKQFKRHWPTRNLHMVDNILAAIKKYPKQKIAILTGYRHRYFLRQFLSKYVASYNFKLLDYQFNRIEK